MHVVDTCGWIEWLTDGSLADTFAPFLADKANLVVPTLVQYELYKWCLRERDEANALVIIGITETCQIKPLDTHTALSAAELSVTHKLALADAVVYATAQACTGELLTSDAQFAGLPGVRYWRKDTAA